LKRLVEHSLQECLIEQNHQQLLEMDTSTERSKRMRGKT
jgi:hypothetical protein